MGGLREATRRLAYWTVPPGIFRAVVDSARAARRGIWPPPVFNKEEAARADAAAVARSTDLHGRHAGQRCFIIATGPSIKNQDLAALQGETCIVVSNFFVHPQYQLIKPRYHCLAPYHLPITEDAWQQWLDELDAKTSGTPLFFGVTDRERNMRGGRFSNRDVNFVEFGASLETIRSEGVALTKPFPGPRSVSTMALGVAIALGFSQVYLLGCDHDWILHLNVSAHFYDEKAHALNRAGYREWSEWSEPDVAMHCQRYIDLWNEYKALRAAAGLASIEVYNATVGGMLDVFPRADLASVVGRR